jgi:hypothetical protein
MVGLAMEQAHAQLSANQVAVSVNEGLAIVGVKLAGQSPTQDGFFECVMKRFGVGLGIIGREGNESGVIIDQDAELSAQRFAVDREGGSRREVHHPQVIDVRRLERLGGAGLQAAGAQTLAVQALGGSGSMFPP